MRPEVQAIRVLLDDAVAGLHPELADRRPVPGRWSVGEIVEHLARTYMGTAKGLQLCLADGRSRATRASLTERARKFVVLRLGWYPHGVEAPQPVRPKQWGFALALERAHGGLDAFDVALTAALDRFGGTTLLLDHPILGPLSANDWCRFHLLHTRHHLPQIADRRRPTGQP
jgi:hypothetical protein